jgi:hypothetical protein
MMAHSEFRPGDRILYLNEDDSEHPFVDVGEIIETHKPCTSSYGEHIPLRHTVQPSNEEAGWYVVQEKSVMDVL